MPNGCWKLDDNSIDVRVEARGKAEAYRQEISGLRDKRQQMQDQMDAVFYAGWNKCAADLESVREARLGLATGMMSPFGSRVGQGTESYMSYRQPFLNAVIIAGNARTDPEWELR